MVTNRKVLVPDVITVGQRLPGQLQSERKAARIALKVAKIEREQANVEAIKEVAIALIQQPATGLIIASLAINGARKIGLLTDIQAGLVQGVVLTGAALTAIGQGGLSLKGLFGG